MKVVSLDLLQTKNIDMHLTYYVEIKINVLTHNQNSDIMSFRKIIPFTT